MSANPAIRLVSVYKVKDAPTYLYALLAERESSVNISHKAMPTAAQHLEFVRSRPYRHWYLILRGRVVVGATYLSKQSEIGIFIFREHRRHGYGRKAVRMLMERHRNIPMLANISPSNAVSRQLFEKLGFRAIQHTYQRSQS